MGEMTVIDGSDTDAQLRDITGEPEKPEQPKPVQPRAKPDDGLTDEERQGLTDKMVRQIGKRTARMKAAEEKAAQTEAQLHASQERIRELEEDLRRLGRGGEAEEDAPLPDPAQFTDQEEYRKAVEKWSDSRVDKRIEARRAAEAKEIGEALVRERLGRARELVPDFDETLKGAQDIQVPDALGGYIQDSPMVAELVYHFAQNPDALKDLARMPMRSPRDLVRLGLALGKIEDRLQPFGANPKEKPSDAGKASSATEIVTPSRPRSSAAIVEPLRPRGTSEIVESDESVTSAVRGFERRNGASLTARKRH